MNRDRLIARLKEIDVAGKTAQELYAEISKA